VARPRHELATSIEQPLELRGHAVERARQLLELARPGLLRPRTKIAACERRRRVAQPPDPAPDRVRDEQARPDRNGRRPRRDGEDLDVVAHVEHRPTGQEDGRERQRHREQRESGEL
jgi:hypothetical protein